MNSPCAEVWPTAKRSYGAKAPLRCAGPGSGQASIVFGQEKKKDTTKGSIRKTVIYSNSVTFEVTLLLYIII